MKRSKAAKIIEKVALKEGVSTSKVREDMQSALNHAYENNGNNVFWLKWHGRKPSLEEFLPAVTDEVLARLGYGVIPLVD